MNDFLKQYLLPFSVFITGACILVVEIVAVRALSPYFGNTTYTFSSVITVILAALSIGYYIGGRFADRHPSLQWFFGIILLSSIILLGFYFIGLLLLPILSVSLSIMWGPFFSSFLLFFAPAFLLGTLSPYAVKLQAAQMPELGVGSVAGTIFFWSTLGSIVGSLLTGFVLIPHFGIDKIFAVVGLILFALGLAPLLLLGMARRRHTMSLFFIVSLTLLILSVSELSQGNILYSKHGMYEKITIYESLHDERPVRVFLQDRSISGAMFLDTNDPTDLVYDYTKYYSLYKAFNPDIRNALVIGGGVYSIPKALLEEIPDIIVDVSEIEPSLYEISKEYFAVSDDPRLRNFTEDGRRLLANSDSQYDFIFSDVYYSLFSIPVHFTTREFFELAKQKLSHEGIFVANLIGDLSRQQPSLIFSEIKTFQSVFPNSYFFAVDSPTSTHQQNIIFVGYNSDEVIDFEAELFLQDSNSILNSLHDKQINLNRFDLTPYPILTDNFAPVEYLTARVLRRAFTESQSIDGHEMLALIDQQLRYGPRYMGSLGHKAVQEFLVAEMEQYTNKVITQSWDYNASDNNTYPLTNIIARIYPSLEKRIILATHYDSKRFADRDQLRPDEPVPGANDSASGVAILVELARLLSNSQPEPSVGVDIIFFDGEEGDIMIKSDYSNWKPLGSTYFAENLDGLYGSNPPLLAVVLDMVCDKNLTIYKEHSSVQHASTQVDAFWNIATKIDSDIFKNDVRWEIFDDHTPLNQVGIPSFLLIDYDYPPFHTTKDTLDKCSAKSLETVAKAVFEYIHTDHW